MGSSLHESTLLCRLFHDVALELSQDSHQRSIGIRCGLKLGGISPAILKPVIAIRSSHNCTCQFIWVWCISVEPQSETFGTWYLSGILVYRNYGGPSVVSLLWIFVAKTHHERHTSRILAQNVIHLQFTYTKWIC